MTRKISILLTVLAMGGCANGAATGAADTTGEGGNDPMQGALDAMASGPMGKSGENAQRIEPLEPLAPLEATEPMEAAGEDSVEMMGMAFGIEVLGNPNAPINACQQFQMRVEAPEVSSAHAPGQLDIAAVSPRCSGSDGGLMNLQIAAHTRTVLEVGGAGFFQYLLQVTADQGSVMMNAVRLLGDDAIAAAYEGISLDERKTTLVVQTPVDDASVELLVGRIGEGPSARYLDADGVPTDAQASIAGGWAVFSNVPQGIHEVFMAHAELDCTPSAEASWPGSNPGSASILAMTNRVSHSNAFGCE